MKPPHGPIDKTLPTPDPSQVQLVRSYGPGHFLIGEAIFVGLEASIRRMRELMDSAR